MTNEIDALEFLDELISIDITPGLVIRARRESLGLTQKEVAEMTGLKTTFLSAVENNKRNIGVQTAQKLAAAIGLHPSSILFPTDTNSNKELEKIAKKREKILKDKAA